MGAWILLTWAGIVVGMFYFAARANRHLSEYGQAHRWRLLGWYHLSRRISYTPEGWRYRVRAHILLVGWIAACILWLLVGREAV